MTIFIMKNKDNLLKKIFENYNFSKIALPLEILELTVVENENYRIELTLQFIWLHDFDIAFIDRILFFMLRPVIRLTVISL